MGIRKRGISYTGAVALKEAIVAAGLEITPYPYETYFEPGGQTVVLLLNENNKGYFRCITLGDQVRPDFADFSDGDYTRAFTVEELHNYIIQLPEVQEQDRNLNGDRWTYRIKTETDLFVGRDNDLPDAMAQALIKLLEA